MNSYILLAQGTVAQTPGAPAAAAEAPAQGVETQGTPAPSTEQQKTPDNGWGSMLLMFAVVIAFIYFFIIRPQKKQAEKQRTMLSAIKAGDKVVTIGGIYGKVVKVENEKYVLEVADNTRIEVAQAGISGVVKTTEETK